MFHYVHHNFLTRCHFDEVFSESCSVGLCKHFDIKLESFPCRIAKIEFSEIAGCGSSRTCETSDRSGFNRQIRHQRSRKLPGTKNQLDI